MTDAPKAQPQSASPDGIWVAALKEAGVALVAAALLLTIFYVFAFRWIYPEFVPFMDREVSKLIVPGKDLIPVSGRGYRVEDNSAIIEDFNGDEAILALPRAFQAEDFPFIKVNLTGFTRYSKFKILWRRAEDLSQTHALEFNRSGNEVTQIAMVYGNENYRGRIADIALLFYDGPALGFENNNDVEISIRSIELRPFSASLVTEQIFEDWGNPPVWQGYSNNIVVGAHSQALLLPNVVSNSLVIVAFLTALTIRLFVRSPQINLRPPFLATVCGICLLAIIFNETLRWTWRTEQALDTHQRYAYRELTEKTRSSSLRCGRFPQSCDGHLLPFF